MGFKTRFIALILCASVFQRGSCVLEKATITRTLTISKPNSTTIGFKGQLYTVSKDQSSLQINSTNIDHKTTIDASKDVTQGRLELTPTDDEIFIVGVKSINGNEQYKYTILKVDTDGNYKSISIPETNDRRGDYFFPRIVKHRTGSDVFFPSLQNCAPCRVDNNGLRSKETISQIPHENSPPGVPFHVKFLDSIDVYFYVYNSHNFSTSVVSTTLKLLDSKDFSTKKERIIDFPVHAVSKQKKSNDQLGICSKTYDDFMADISAYTEVRCDRLNNDLATINTIRIPIEPHSQPISSISHEFDKQGNSFTSFAEDSELRLYIHDKNGKLVKALDLGKVDKKFEEYPANYNPMEFDAYDYWDVNGFLVGDDEYCIVTEQVATNYPTPLHQVRCADVKKLH